MTMSMSRSKAAHPRNQQKAAGPSHESIIYPQVALVALNPHTGQVLALVGGRNYGTSQLNHAVAQRPTGSIFKPFVYAAAFKLSRCRHHACRARTSCSHR